MWILSCLCDWASLFSSRLSTIPGLIELVRHTVLGNVWRCQSCCSWQRHAEEWRFNYRTPNLSWGGSGGKVTWPRLGRSSARPQKVTPQLLQSFIITCENIIILANTSTRYQANSHILNKISVFSADLSLQPCDIAIQMVDLSLKPGHFLSLVVAWSFYLLQST